MRPGSQADDDGGVLGAGAAARLGEVDEGRRRNQQHQQHHLDDGQQTALQSGQLIGPLQE